MRLLRLSALLESLVSHVIVPRVHTILNMSTTSIVVWLLLLVIHLATMSSAIIMMLLVSGRPVQFVCFGVTLVLKQLTLDQCHRLLLLLLLRFNAYILFGGCRC